MKTEEVGAELYQRLAQKFSSDRELCELFEGLGRDERQHRDLFQALHDRTLSRYRDQKVPSDQQDYLKAMSLSDLFTAMNVEGIRTRDDALERALNLEKTTLGYYLAMREIVGPDEALDSLIAVEKKHIVKVMQLMVTGAKYRGLADNF
jgi:rubrerythrin